MKIKSSEFHNAVRIPGTQSTTNHAVNGVQGLEIDRHEDGVLLIGGGVVKFFFASNVKQIELTEDPRSVRKAKAVA